jgi:hypothetical protein
VLFGFDPAKPLDLLYDLIRPWGALRYLRQKQDTRLEVSFWSQMDADKWAKEWNVMIFEGKELYVEIRYFEDLAYLAFNDLRSTEQSDKIENDPVSLLMSRTRDIETRRTSWKVEEHVSRKSPPVQVIRNPPKMAEHKSIQTVANLMENKTSQTNTNVSWSDRSTQTELMPASKDASSQTDMVHARPRPICELTQPFGSTSHNDIDRLLLRWSRTADIHPDSVAELTMYSADEVWKYLAFLGDGGTKGRLAGLSKMDDEMMGLTLSWLSREKDEGDTRRVICEKLTKLSRVRILGSAFAYDRLLSTSTFQAWGYKQHSRAVAENFLSKGDPWSILLLMKCHPYIMRGMIARAGKNGPPSV